MDNQPPTSASSSNFTPPPDHPKRILLVEDDDALAGVYLTRLQTEGFDVRRVANGEDALATQRVIAAIISKGAN